MTARSPSRASRRLPVVDLSVGPDMAAHAVRSACRDTGFFYVVNHGVPEALIDGQIEWARQLFALDDEAKDALDWKRSPCRRGLEPIQHRAPRTDPPPDLKESFYIGRDLGPDHPYVRRGLPNHGPNVWPEALPGFRAHSEAYFDALRALAQRLMGVLAVSLDLPADWFAPLLAEPMPVMRLVHYPAQAPDAETHRLAAAAHTDWGGLTLLAQDDVGGLEVRALGGDWIRATPFAGTFVANVGDLVARWTNGRYRSSLHRVVNRTGRDRYSIVFFFNPDAEARIECLPTCRDAGRAPRYAPCTAGEYVEEMVRRTQHGKQAA